MPNKLPPLPLLAALLFAPLASAQSSPADGDTHLRDTVQAVMQTYDIPGLVIGITEQGQHRFYAFGEASRAAQTPVTADTLFEVGSITKTLAASLAALGQVEGRLKLSDSVGQHVPEVADTAFGRLPLSDLATHATGGMPLQVPDGIDSEKKLFTYLRGWTPEHAPGTWRAYSNISIGMLSMAAARSFQQPFDQALTQRLFTPLGMTHSYTEVPADQQAQYALGYTADNQPIRVKSEVLGPESYGLKTNARDLLRFVDANLGRLEPGSPLGQAIALTHTAYYRAGPLTQDLVWEHYPLTAPLDERVAGNDTAMILKGLSATAIQPPEAMPTDAPVWVNKTGSTRGFGAYVAFVPSKQQGIVILANKNYPNAARVRLAHALLE